LSASGLRERKKLKTKTTIQREAMRLFKKQGYGATTVEQIAEAAEISPSTFFNYFPTKEDVVLFDQYDPMMLELLTSNAVPTESLGQSIKRALDGFAGAFERDREIILERATLGLEVPEIRARLWEELEKARDLFAGIIATRTGRDRQEFELKVVSMVLVTAAFQASLEWIERGGRGSMLSLAQEALEIAGVYSMLDGLGEKPT
jgi:AcrR family transcriptional regulator